MDGPGWPPGARRRLRVVAHDRSAFAAGVARRRTWTGLPPRLACDNGILVDDSLRTSAREVFAAGDAANAVHPFYGRAAAGSSTGTTRSSRVPAAARMHARRRHALRRIPYFFSDQYDVGMEYAGYAREWEEVVFRGDVEAREFIAFWLQGGRVVAGMNVNVWDVTDAIQALIRSRKLVDLAQLRDPGVPLEDLDVAMSESQARPRRARCCDWPRTARAGRVAASACAASRPTLAAARRAARAAACACCCPAAA